MKRKKLIIFGIFLVLIGIGYFVIRSGSDEKSYESITATRGKLVQTVNVTGKVTPAERVNLAFEKSGRVKSISAITGSVASRGDILLSLENSDLLAQQAEAQANIKAQQAKLDELLRGTRDEELRVLETKVLNAEKSLEDARVSETNTVAQATNDLQNLYDDVKNLLGDTHIKANDAISKQIDSMFNDDNTSNPKLTFVPSDSQAKSDSELLRITTGVSVKNLKNSIATLSNEESARDQALVDATLELRNIDSLLTALRAAVDSATGISAATITTYKTNLNTARININTALISISDHGQAIKAQRITNQKNLDAASEAIRDAQSALASARDELLLKVAGATSEQISAQSALVDKAHASADNIAAQISKTILRAPIDGSVTNINTELGEIVSMNTVVISLISQNNFELEAFIPETDIVKVMLEDVAQVTLDAYGNDIVFEATVAKIAPAETIIEGVPTYETTLLFTSQDNRIRSGMTANVDILTAEKDDVIAIPQRAVLFLEDNRYVRVVDNSGNIEKRPVSIGIRGSDGRVEIESGISSGDEVVTFISQ